MSIELVCMQAVCGTGQVSYQGQVLDLEKPFKRATMHELVQEAIGQSSCLCCIALASHLDFSTGGLHDAMLMQKIPLGRVILCILLPFVHVQKPIQLEQP